MARKKVINNKNDSTTTIKETTVKVEEKIIEESESEKIWNKIKDMPIDIFALPNQTIKMHVIRESKLEKAFPDSVYIKIKSAAVLPALEETLGKISLGKNKAGQQLIFNISQMDTYTVIKIIPRA